MWEDLTWYNCLVMDALKSAALSWPGLKIQLACKMYPTPHQSPQWAAFSCPDFQSPCSCFISADCTICFNRFNQRSWLWCLIGHFHLGVSWIAWWFQKESMSEDKLGKWACKKTCHSSSPCCSILSVARLPQTVLIPPHFLPIQSSRPPAAHRATASSLAA